MAPTRMRREDAGARIEVREKSETELLLEKALFGDDAGFLDALKPQKLNSTNVSLQLRRRSTDKDSSDGQQTPDIEDGADEDLFFLDTGPATLSVPLQQDLDQDEPEEKEVVRKAAWYDSDDDKIVVSLASNTRLRKLRDTEADDVVSGREYIRRLRRQYERLHPAPEWAAYGRKRKRDVQNGSKDDEASDSDVSMDDVSLNTTRSLSELLHSAGASTQTNAIENGAKKRRRLRPEVVDIQRTRDVTASGPSSVDTLQFHPYYPLLLTGGPSSTVNLYHVSPDPPNPNPLLTSLHVKGTPLHTAAFCTPHSTFNSQSSPESDPTRIYFSSRRRYFHVWSLATGSVNKVTRPVYGDARKEQRTMESFKISPCGRYMGIVGSSRKGGGTIHVLSIDTTQLVSSCRIDSGGGVADFAWWRDGNGFAVVGKNGEVSEYDVESQRVLVRWMDEGAVGTTIIALGGESGDKPLGGSQWVAIGSSSGIVNVYDRRGWGRSVEESTLSLRPKPTRAFDQLTTPISHLEFSCDGQMLVMASRWKKNALRLLHLPSCTVYRNWPTDKTPLGRVSSVAFGMEDSYLAVGNEKGSVRLWSIRA